MSRKRTGAALLGAVVAVATAGSVASAGADPNVPETSVETSAPTTEPTAPAAPDTFTLSVWIPDISPGLEPSAVTVGVVADGSSSEPPEYVAGPVTCPTFDTCARFPLEPGEYDLLVEIEQTRPNEAWALFPAADSESGLDIRIVDRDITVRFDFVATAVPTTPSTSPSSTSTSSTTTTSVAAGGPTIVGELPATGSGGRVGSAALVLVAVGLGCVVAARRRLV